MEFMDFQLYSLAAAIVFNQLFFPDVSPAIGLIAAMATYGVGYVARLAGAIYFGRMGDRIGRKRVLFLTILLMGASTTLIGVLPTYAKVGILAPILLVVLRLVQGFGAGAEIAGATVMLAEYAPVATPRPDRLAGLARHQLRHARRVRALGVPARRAVSEEQLLAWGWRLPFLLSFVLMIFAVWLRANLKESPVFEERPDVVDGVALDRDRGRGADAASVLEAGLHAAQGQGVLPRARPAVRPGRQLRPGPDLPRRLHRHHAARWTARSHRRHRLRLAARASSPCRSSGLLGDRFGRRPIYIALSAADRRARLPDDAADHQRQHRRADARHGRSA